MAETRARLLDAALELFETVGPAQTSMSGVADRAGTTRATLYRHFAGDAELANAVIDEWSTGNPAPDVDALADIEDPIARLRAGLGSLYGSYRATGALTANLFRDVHVLPAARRADLRGAARQVLEVLGDARPGLRASPLAEAARAHAVAFETWRSLSAQGLADADIVDLMAALVSATRTTPAAPTSKASKAAKAAPATRTAKAAKAARATKTSPAVKAARATRTARAATPVKAGKSKGKGNGKKDKGDRNAKQRRSGGG